MTVPDIRPVLIRLLTVARTEIAALTALFVAAVGVVSFVELADDMTEADGQAFDQQVLALLRPYADDPGRPWGPWWLKEAAADITSLGGISVLGLFALIAIAFLLSQRKWLSSLLLALGLTGGVMLS
jgi:undecaprenyl-diphosphatase